MIVYWLFKINPEAVIKVRAFKAVVPMVLNCRILPTRLKIDIHAYGSNFKVKDSRIVKHLSLLKRAVSKFMIHPAQMKFT
jgi:hypothetical protein